jgi:hypothetical protein
MNCEQVQQAIRVLDRADRRSGLLASPVRNHLLGCERCAGSWARVQRLDAAFDGLREATASDVPAPAIERRLIEAFREAQAGRVAADVRPTRWSWVARPWIARAAAVIAAFAVGSAVAIYRHDSMINTPEAPASPARPVAVPHVGSGSVQAVDDLAAAAPGEAAGADDTVEAASDFVVLPYGPPTLEDPVHLVQVALPTQTLLDFSLDGPTGFAQLPPDADDIVAVDVLVDDFGNARAIRLTEPADGPPSDLDAGSSAFD